MPGSPLRATHPKVNAHPDTADALYTVSASSSRRLPQEFERILDQMNQDKWQTRALREDNRKMREDIDVHRRKKGIQGSLEDYTWDQLNDEPAPEH